MQRTTLWACESALLVMGLAAPAAAQDARIVGETGPTYWTRAVMAPRQAFELTAATGYTQGFGRLQKGASVTDTAEAGMSLDVGAGYRLSPEFALGLRAGYQFYAAGNGLVQNDSPGGATGALNASFHFDPYSRLDPWLEAATGYRYLCECGQPGVNTRLHGLDLIGAKLGLDLRVDRQLAVAPLVGADLGLFLWNRTDAIADPRLNTFIYAGIQGRIDLGGEYVHRSQVAHR